MHYGVAKLTDISVMTATLNSEAWLQRCIDSVLEQESVAVQHVLIDGGSTDGTIDILNCQKDPRVHVLLGQDSGVYEAWNKGVRAATGDWILFLGSDDFLLAPDVFRKAMDLLHDKRGQRVFAYGNVLKGNVDGSGTPERYGYWDPTSKAWGGPTKPYPPHPSTLHSRCLFDTAAPFDESYRYSADAKFFFRNFKSSTVMYLDMDVVWFSNGGLTNQRGNQLARWNESNRLRREMDMKPKKIVLLKSFLSALKHHMIFFICRKSGN
jgi:glycosyltransferase involved in cell wall biosynthesis